MYESVMHTAQFDTAETRDMAQYDAILNNPLCIIVQETHEKLTQREFGDEGTMMANDRLLKIVTWKEKKLL